MDLQPTKAKPLLPVRLAFKCKRKRQNLQFLLIGPCIAVHPPHQDGHHVGPGHRQPHLLLQRRQRQAADQKRGSVRRGARGVHQQGADGLDGNLDRRPATEGQASMDGQRMERTTQSQLTEFAPAKAFPIRMLSFCVCVGRKAPLVFL